PIHWFVTPDKEQPGRLAAVTEALPGDLSAAGTAAIATQIQLSPTDPDEGFIKGVIDLPTLARFAGPDDFRTLKELEAAGLAGTPCPGQTRYELVFTADGLSQAKAYEDNKVWIEYRKQDLTNVRVQVEAPAAVEWEPEASYTATFRITNEGQSPVTVVTTADLASNTGSLSARLMTATLTLAPGETAVRTRSVPLAMCGETNTVTATVNPEPRAFAETTFADNQATARTTASACGEGAGHDSGRTMTVIVPADCIPNPDMESPRPCLNYDLTIPDRP
ncbi:MAG TPA: hypothetical protein VD973_15335, partial [Symbiobacteriaceae bacterium]|nr:hypothetical protein [Symbiobacteriaceae bacterium]